jgi:hypothetical protein
MPGTGQLGQVFHIATGGTAVAVVSLTLNGAPYVEPVCITPLVVSPEGYVPFRLVRSKDRELRRDNAHLVIVETNPFTKPADFTVQFGWFTP